MHDEPHGITRRIRTSIARALMFTARATILFGNLQTRGALRVAPLIVPEAAPELEAPRTGYWDELAKEAERACALYREHEARTVSARMAIEADVEAALTRLAGGQQPGRAA